MGYAEARADRRLADVLDAARAHHRATGRLDVPSWAAHCPRRAAEVRRLLLVVAALERAARAWRSATGSPGPWEATATPSTAGRRRVTIEAQPPPHR